MKLMVRIQFKLNTPNGSALSRFGHFTSLKPTPNTVLFVAEKAWGATTNKHTDEQTIFTEKQPEQWAARHNR